MKKRVVILTICLSLILILSISFISAGLFSDLWNKITGQAAAPYEPPITDPIETGYWTIWFDRDNPGGTGDYEDIATIRQWYPNKMEGCDEITQIECRVKSTQEDYTTTGQNVTCNTE